MLGDTGIARLHPDDERYRVLVRKKNVRLPLVDRLIPIVEPTAPVDATFGSGATWKVTPALQAGGLRDRHAARLWPRSTWRPPDAPGSATRRRSASAAFDRYHVARKMVVAEFDGLGLLVKIDKHQHARGATCYRCNTVVEPRLSDQWFVKVKPMADRVNAAYRAGDDFQAHPGISR